LSYNSLRNTVASSSRSLRPQCEHSVPRSLAGAKRDIGSVATPSPPAPKLWRMPSSANSRSQGVTGSGSTRSAREGGSSSQKLLSSDTEVLGLGGEVRGGVMVTGLMGRNGGAVGSCAGAPLGIE
ncbi:Hypothetical predicted protein, partial [Marmota monax]